MSTATRLAQAREDLSAARAARADAVARRDEARALEAEQEHPRNRERHALRVVSARMHIEAIDKEIAALLVEIASLEAPPVVLTAAQCAAVDETAGLAP